MKPHELLTSAVLGRCLAAIVLLSGPYSADDAVAGADPEDEYTEPDLSDNARDHWSLRPLGEIAVPDLEDADQCRTPIDRFILSSLRKAGLVLQPPAPERVLRRRLALKLTGLPPAGRLSAADLAGRDFEAFTDELLADSAYGEHWAQFWLDLARFAETDGFEHDQVRPEAWKFRDWVIQALNRDMGYDEFLRLQLAGDLLHPEDKSAVAATHFCVAGPDMPDLNLQEERRHNLLNEMTATIGEAVLGLQLGCAQCHDHKYDPISQADFYRLRAILEPAVQVEKNVSVNRLHQMAGPVEPSHLKIRGDFRRSGLQVLPGIPRVIANGYSADRDSVNPRILLVDWLTSRENPLTARVIVNRVWQQHFGVGISSTPSDFGIMGQEPVHSDLLDWLSRWFVDNGWSLKKLNRLIVSSAVWRQRSLLPEGASPTEQDNWRKALQIDSDGQLVSRFPRQRLTGEVIRDAMLQIAGILNRRAGGPGVRPPLPDELKQTLLRNQWEVTEDVLEHNRRSVYVFARRNLRFPVFEVFDRPAAISSCAVRHQSTTAPQSLYLLNSELTWSIAGVLSEEFHNGQYDRADAPEWLFQRILGRLPEKTEAQDMADFLTRSADENPLQNACVVLLNANEFVYPD